MWNRLPEKAETSIREYIKLFKDKPLVWHTSKRASMYRQIILILLSKINITPIVHVKSLCQHTFPHTSFSNPLSGIPLSRKRSSGIISALKSSSSIFHDLKTFLSSYEQLHLTLQTFPKGHQSRTVDNLRLDHVNQIFDWWVLVESLQFPEESFQSCINRHSNLIEVWLFSY